MRGSDRLNDDSQMLAARGRAAEHEAIFRAERDITRAEAGADAVHDEDRDWDRTVDDGIA